MDSIEVSASEAVPPEEAKAAPRRGGGAGKPQPEAAPERRRAARKAEPRPDFSDEAKKPEEKEEPEEESQEDQPKDKAANKQIAPKTVTVVIRIVKRDIPHARLLAREAKKEAAETIPDKGK